MHDVLNSAFFFLIQRLAMNHIIPEGNFGPR